MFQVMSFMSDSHPNRVNRIPVAATGRSHYALAAIESRRRHDAQPTSLTPVAHGTTAPDIRCNDAAAAYADDCFGESKIVRAGLAWPMPAHDTASNLNDRKRIVAFVAEESQVPIADAEILYEHERAELALGAHITKFLHIFAVRNVQEILRKRELDKHLVPLGRPASLASAFT